MENANSNNEAISDKISVFNFSKILSRNYSILHDEKIYNKLASIAEDIPEGVTSKNISEKEANSILKNLKLIENELKLLLLQYQNLDDESFTNFDSQATINDTNELLADIKNVKFELQSASGAE